MSDQSRTNEKFSLTIREASDYFCIGQKKMRRLAEDNLGKFSVYNGNRFLIIRAEFEEYLRSTPILKDSEEELKRREQLDCKSIFIPEEAIEFYELSRRRLKRLLEEDEELPFVAYYKKRKVIIRDEFEKYMEENPELKEALRNG